MADVSGRSPGLVLVQLSRVSRWVAWVSVVPGGLRRKAGLPGSSMASQYAAHSGW